MGSRLVGDFKEDGKVKQRRDPENHVENQRAKKFRKYYLPVTYRDTRQWLNHAESHRRRETSRKAVDHTSDPEATPRVHVRSFPSLRMTASESSRSTGKRAALHWTLSVGH